MNTETLEIYEILKRNFSEQDAKKVVNYFEDTKEKAITSAVERKTEHMASKSDLAETKADLIKWMFIFWMGLLIPIVGLLIAILGK